MLGVHSQEGGPESSPSCPGLRGPAPVLRKLLALALSRHGMGFTAATREVLEALLSALETRR